MGNNYPVVKVACRAGGFGFSRSRRLDRENHFPTSGDPMRNRVSVDSQAFAQMSKAWVVSACGTVDEDMIRKLEVGPEAEKFLRSADCCGGSVIVAPNSRIVAGPMGAEEGILYAECNLELGILTKLRHDFAGHYNRPDIFQLHMNRSAPRIYTVHTTADQLPGAQPSVAIPPPTVGEPPARLPASPRRPDVSRASGRRAPRRADD